MASLATWPTGEWSGLASVAELCGDYPSLLIDLPGHGQSATLKTRDFADVSEQLTQTLQANGIRKYWLAGYSLGAELRCTTHVMVSIRACWACWLKG